jgi:hypothetical protein
LSDFSFGRLLWRAYVWVRDPLDDLGLRGPVTQRTESRAADLLGRFLWRAIRALWIFAAVLAVVSFAIAPREGPRWGRAKTGAGVAIVLLLPIGAGLIMTRPRRTHGDRDGAA